MAKADKKLNNEARNIDSLGKVVVHNRKHQVHRGFSKKDFITDEVRILDENGNESSYPLNELKAIFFVKEFAGDPAYDEVLFLSKEQPSPWLWVHIQFEDGEIIEGKIRNNRDILSDSAGFFVWISDEFANSESVYVIKDYVKKFSIMG